MSEEAVTFECHGSQLIGILHRPERTTRAGVVMVVGGGPQYRAGGHRQLVIWSRRLVESGYAVLRFDYRGMGDSNGTFPTFEYIDDDIRAATDALSQRVPGIQEIVLWGECDASSAIMFYAYRDPRVCGAVLLNPWVRTENIRARAVVRHYYLRRLAEPSFWKKLFSFKMNPFSRMRDFMRNVQRSRVSVDNTNVFASADKLAPLSRQMPLPDRLLAGVRRFNGRIMLVMSGRDLIAREFDELVRASPEWQAELARKDLTRHDLTDGDHTFSSAKMRDQVATWALAWLQARNLASETSGEPCAARSS